METLAIIAYHQPVTRPEIEEIRGTSLSQQTLDALLEADLIAPKGRRESPGPADAVGHHAAVPGAVRPARICANCRAARTCCWSRRQRREPRPVAPERRSVG